MTRSTRIFAATFAILAATLAPARVGRFDGTATLKRTPKVGDACKYKVAIKIDTPEGPAAVSMVDTRTIASVQPDGSYVEKDANTEGKVNLQGKELPMDEERTTTTYLTTGVASKIESVDAKGVSNVTADSYRTENLQGFYPPSAPVKVGDSWSFALAADVKLGSVAVKSDFKVDSAEKIGAHDTFKVKFTNKEEGTSTASVDGFVWVDVHTGVLVKISAKLNNIPVPDSVGAISGTVDIALTD